MRSETQGGKKVTDNVLMAQAKRCNCSDFTHADRQPDVCEQYQNGCLQQPARGGG